MLGIWQQLSAKHPALSSSSCSTGNCPYVRLCYDRLVYRSAVTLTNINFLFSKSLTWDPTPNLEGRGATSSSIRGGAIFMKFHSMTSSWLFNRGTTFSQTGTYNNNVFFPADTKSTVQTHTFCTTLVTKNRKNRTFYNSVGGWITGVKRNFSLAQFLASRHMRMHRATFNISNTLRKLMIWA